MNMIVTGLNPGENVHLVGEVVPVLWKKSLHIDHLCSLTLLSLHLVANTLVLKNCKSKKHLDPWQNLSDLLQLSVGQLVVDGEEDSNHSDPLGVPACLLKVELSTGVLI